MEPGAAVHLSFDHFQPVDLALDLTGAPWRLHGRGHGHLPCGCCSILRTSRCEIGVVALALCVPFYALIGVVLSLLSGVIRSRYDLYLANIDGICGFQPSALVNGFLSQSPCLFAFTAFVYKALPAIGVLVFVLYLWATNERAAVGVLKVLLLNAALSLPCYFVFPACGPIYAFATFPNFPNPLPTAHTVLLSGAPNAMPSIHFSTALLIYWYVRRWPLGQVLGIVFILLTVLATLGFGEHYLIDVVMAVLYAVGIQWLSRRLWPGMRIEQPAYVEHATAGSVRNPKSRAVAQATLTAEHSIEPGVAELVSTPIEDWLFRNFGAVRYKTR